ncbi:MAG: SGNH/GDSL hydrolase family protein [Sedimenticola sp.]
MNFGLCEHRYEVHIHGIGGLCLRNDRFSRLHRVDSLIKNCDVAFIDIGSNDLCNSSYSPDTFASDLIAYLQYVNIGLNVQRVGCSQLLPRLNTPYPEYNENIVQANTTLHTNLTPDKHSQIQFWRHQCGLWNPNRLVDIYCPDGIHLSDIGLKKYYQSVKDCLHRLINAVGECNISR